MSNLTWRDLLLVVIFEIGKIALLGILFITDWTIPGRDGVISPILAVIVFFIIGQVAVIETGVE